MGDHFVLLVDRLLTESSLEAAIQCKNSLQHPSLSPGEDMSTDFNSHRMDINVGSSSPAELVQCRICHDEDEDCRMDIPCSCRGSLKYAHYECVQKWCNEKGDNVCEICCQPYKPSYTVPPTLLHCGGIPMNLRGFRGHWEISREGLNNPEFIAMFSANRNSMDPDFDEYSDHAPRSLIYCRLVAITFTMLLMFRHTLPIIITVVGDHSVALLDLLMLSIGIVTPIYIAVKAFQAIRHRLRQRQDARDTDTTTTDERNEQQHPPHLVHVH
ncbi:PREDICTED: uncharacterized protein LOC109177549 isoform X1 [Ipomoea nil]|uniref:uncharacterized protein LOC109177549 isoform X1 n=3 Tax=Ipomoea nil TaxID=35883 RepID=UPI000900985A|nr:PREDICTED: uncharacterized protein LOC109177549 isoform X1 [Ipomoea nil]XP_019182477.1 PREDICTED: uncharacterized protein LOC109177549 isoform X1 [Ipomoea nil]XP_019182478.1 PREDICTED: uncharacterized protein LOC109177549 isoform X1 [Ipomoea nil]XP_019182479.1 PREDICTED: uncharacterized protein LOC109177549 isoform X1 [Ipomoea nil]